MVQFYLLSVVMNALGGYILIKGDDDGVLELKNVSFKNEVFRLVVGILSAIVGLLKILSVIEGDVPVIGDLIPALTGFLSGFILIFTYYRSHSSLDVTEQTEKTEKVDRLLVANKKIIGFTALIAAALHFLFPTVLLL